MTDTVVQSFCERCGKRYSVPVQAENVEPPPSPAGVLGRFKRKGREVQEAPVDLVPQGSAEAGTVHFCLECRRYNCTDCWNEQAGLCVSCRPHGQEAAPTLTAAWATGRASASGVELDEWGRPRKPVPAPEVHAPVPTSAATDADASTIFGPAGDADPWRGVVFSADEPPTTTASASAALAEAPLAESALPPARSWPPMPSVHEDSLPEGPLGAPETHDAAEEARPDDAWPEPDMAARSAGASTADDGPESEEVGVELTTRGLPPSLSDTETHVDAVDWARASAMVVGRGSLLPAYPDLDDELPGDEEREEAWVAAVPASAVETPETEPAIEAEREIEIEPAIETEAAIETAETDPIEIEPATVPAAVRLDEPTGEEAAVARLAESEAAPEPPFAEAATEVSDAQTGPEAHVAGIETEVTVEAAHEFEPVASVEGELAAAPEQADPVAIADPEAVLVASADPTDLEAGDSIVELADEPVGAADPQQAAAEAEPQLEALLAAALLEREQDILELGADAQRPTTPAPTASTDATEAVRVEPGPLDATVVPEPVPAPPPVEPGPPTAPSRPIAPAMPPPSLEVWSTSPEPGPFAQPYQAPAPPSPAAQAVASTSAALPPGVDRPPLPAPPMVPVPPPAPMPPSALTSATRYQAPLYLPQMPGPAPLPRPSAPTAPVPVPGPVAPMRAPTAMPSPVAAAPVPPAVLARTPGPSQPGVPVHPAAPSAGAQAAVRAPQGPTRACPTCSLPLSTKARFCRRCGAPQPG